MTTNQRTKKLHIARQVLDRCRQADIRAPWWVRAILGMTNDKKRKERAA